MKRVVQRLRDSSGFTLVETIATIIILTLAVTMIALAGTNGLRMLAGSERTAIASNFQADSLAKARQADFAELGFYADQISAAGPGYVSGSAAGLPLGSAGSPISEMVVRLGSAAPGVLPFDVQPVETFYDDEDDPRVAYRATTWVTESPIDTSSGTVSAKRVTVLVEWAPLALEGELDRSCSNPEVHCSVQTIVRAATGADVDGEDKSAWATSPCNASSPTAAAVCETYVRSGRVLDGSSMVTSRDLPAQRQPVDFYLRTSTAVDSVVASWSYTVDSGTGPVVVAKSVTLDAVDAGTRWAATVPADPEDGSPRGDIRPGLVNITFSAQKPDGSVTTSTAKAFWSVGLDRYAALAVDPASVVGTCTATGGPITFTVTGHSAGMTTTNVSTAADDKVRVAFPRRIGATTDTVVVDAVLVSTTPTIEVIAGTPVQVATSAVWQVASPATSDCSVTGRGVAQVHRAVDRTITNIPLGGP